MEQEPILHSKQPDPKPPDFLQPEPPSLWLYFVFILSAIVLVWLAFIINGADWAALLLNFATELLGALVVLMIIERRFRKAEIMAFRKYTSDFPYQILSLASPNVSDALGYSKVFANQVRAVKPEHYVSRQQFENIANEYGDGFLITGMAGIGKTTLVQNIASTEADEVVKRPLKGKIPVYIRLHDWRDGNIIQEIQRQILSYYPVRAKVMGKWLRKRKMLVIFDGLDEHQNPEMVINEIETLRQLAPNIQVCVTSREHTVPAKTVLPKIILDTFTMEETYEQIQKLGMSRKDYAEQIQRISKGHPLASAIATGIAKRGGNLDNVDSEKS